MTRDNSINLTPEERRSKLLSPSLDFAFKRLFGVESKKKILLCLLNSILRDNPKIEDIELDNTEIPRDNRDGKDVRLDIRARTPNGTIVTIEIQCINRGEIINRSNFYQARLMESELKSGVGYDSIPDMISIWIADYSATKRQHHTSEIIYMYKESEKDPLEVATNKFRTFIIELPKLEYKTQERLDEFTIWMTFLKHPEMITKKIINQIPEVGEAMQELEHLSLDGGFRERYEARQKAINDEISALAVATREGEERGWMMGREEGRVEGEEYGLRIGEERGLERGRIEAATSMLRENIPEDIISRCTGLTFDEVLRLKKT
jgi:predicted transposase/invertase (TIGR01784 family)